MDTLELIVKPCQSGKTFIMLQEIARMLEYDENIIHIIFCDNQLLQTKQTSNRVNTFEDLSEYKVIDEDGLETYKDARGDVSIILSSKSKIKKYTELTHYISIDYKTIILCSNRKRVDDIDKWIKSLTNDKRYINDKFCIWIDEIDKNMSLFSEKLDEWRTNKKIIRIGLITATPEALLKKYDQVKIFQLEKSHDPDKYHSFQESEFKLHDLNDLEIHVYIKQILEDNSDDLCKGQVWFVPGEVNTTSHSNIKEVLQQKGFVVFVINGEYKKLYNDDDEEIELDNINDENLSDVLGNIYKEYKLKNKKVAITGNLCISRGITINSEKMLITHAILPNKISNRSNCYQLAGRICGNIKEFKKYKKPIIYCNQKFKNIIIEMEVRAKNLAEIAFREEKTSVTLHDYKNSGLKKSVKLHRIFKTSAEARKWGEENLGIKFRKQDDLAPTELQVNGKNPSLDYVLKRMWGVSGPKNKARLIPTCDSGWVMYWDPKYTKKHDEIQIEI